MMPRAKFGLKDSIALGTDGNGELGMCKLHITHIPFAMSTARAMDVSNVQQRATFLMV